MFDKHNLTLNLNGMYVQKFLTKIDQIQKGSPNIIIKDIVRGYKELSKSKGFECFSLERSIKDLKDHLGDCAISLAKLQVMQEMEKKDHYSIKKAVKIKRNSEIIQKNYDLDDEYFQDYIEGDILEVYTIAEGIFNNYLETLKQELSKAEVSVLN